MNTRLFLKAVVFVLAVCCQAQAQMMKPSVMVVPSDQWCKNNGFLTKGSDEYYPDYRKAVLNSQELPNVISKINIIMADRGFPLEDLESTLKSLKTGNVEKKLYTAKDGGAIVSTPIDEIYRTASADIVLKINWQINKIGPKNAITFNMQAIDSYTNKQVAGAQGTGSPSFSASADVLLNEAVVQHMDAFCDRLLQHFKEVKANGREISIEVYKSENASIDFSEEYGDYELAEVIARHIKINAVGHKMSSAPSSDTMLQFKSVRCPVTDSEGLPMDAYAFARNIARTLKKAPYNLQTKVYAKGLAKAIMIIGE